MQLRENQYDYLQQQVNPLEDDGNNGIEHYLKTVDIVERFLEARINVDEV